MRLVAHGMQEMHGQRSPRGFQRTLFYYMVVRLQSQGGWAGDRYRQLSTTGACSALVNKENHCHVYCPQGLMLSSLVSLLSSLFFLSLSSLDCKSCFVRLADLGASSQSNPISLPSASRGWLSTVVSRLLSTTADHHRPLHPPQEARRAIVIRDTLLVCGCFWRRYRSLLPCPPRHVPVAAPFGLLLILHPLSFATTAGAQLASVAEGRTLLCCIDTASGSIRTRLCPSRRQFTTFAFGARVCPRTARVAPAPVPGLRKRETATQRLSPPTSSSRNICAHVFDRPLHLLGPFRLQ